MYEERNPHDESNYKTHHYDLTPSTSQSTARSATPSPSSSTTSIHGPPTSPSRTPPRQFKEYEKDNQRNPSPSSTSPAGLLFGGCCASPSGRRSWDDTQVVERPERQRKPVKTGELIRKLAQAEAEGQNMVHIARVKRKEALESAKQEADKEARLYAEQFEIEFAKLEARHLEEMERFSSEAERRVDKDIAKEAKRGHRTKQQTMFYVLDRTCDVDLSLPEVAANRIQRIAARTPSSRQDPRGILQHKSNEHEHGEGELNDASLEQYGLCPKHRSPENPKQSSSSASRQKSDDRGRVSSNIDSMRSQSGNDPITNGDNGDVNESPSKETLHSILVSKNAAENVHPSP